METMMSADEFVELMKQSAGDDPGIDFGRSDLMETTFDDLGFDSLSQVELVERLSDLLGLPMPDEVVDELTTPKAMLRYVQTETPAP
jgi:act minimal PKS acyl carrier protein